MNVTIIGGSGLIGRKLGPLLERAGHRVVLASPSQGVNTLTGEGLAQAVAGADVVVDVSNSPSFEARAVLQFFRTSTTNLLAAEASAGVRHHVALSVVGADRLADNGYMRAKVAQEALIQEGQVPYTIVRATQQIQIMNVRHSANLCHRPAMRLLPRPPLRARRQCRRKRKMGAHARFQPRDPRHQQLPHAA